MPRKAHVCRVQPPLSCFLADIGKRFVVWLDQRLPPIPEVVIMVSFWMLCLLYLVIGAVFSPPGWFRAAFLSTGVVAGVTLLIRNSLCAEDDPKHVRSHARKRDGC